jgi:serine/threonine protein kinase/formylglycine-generating enzyme required for sulfatase activity
MPESFEFEHYQLLRNEDGTLAELGRGAMGITYKAFDTNLRCNVALKVITGTLLEDPIAAERFLREARSAAQLRHRNVASVFHLGKHGSSYFYAMEFIDGETVDARVKREGPLDCLFALDIAQQVASALIAAEKQHLVHRDIKPSNLMLVREGDGEILVKVIDFGLVKSVVMQSTAAGALTLSGFVGTPYFASPEQLDRQAEDIRSDIYSLGITLWFMLTGRPTFLGSMASVIAQHLDRAPPFESLAILPAEVVSVLRRMLEKDILRRIQTPADLRLELKSCIERLRNQQAPEKLSRPGDWNFETIELSSRHPTALLPPIGSLLKERYRLLEDLDSGNPGHIYHGEDIRTKTRVAIRIFQAPPEILTEIEQQAKRLQAVSHPNFLKFLTIERERTFSFAVREWLESFPLVDLLRARRALTLRETCMLLKQIASAVDAALAANLHLEMNLRDILVHFPEGFGQPVADTLLRCPLDEWPAFVVKLDALTEINALENSATQTGEQTLIDRPGDIQDVIRLGILVYELMGGKPGGFAPLANTSEEGNRILRQCLTPGRSFATARDFYVALSAVSDSKPPAGPIPLPLSGGEGSQLNALSATRNQPLAVKPPAGVAISPPDRAPDKHRYLPIIGLVALALVILGAFCWFFVFRSQNPNQEPVTVHPTVAQQKQTKTQVARPPLTAGKPWTNSLEMRFVPQGDAYLAVWQTRVKDFEAFVQATGYDAVGGMSSVVTQNGFKLNTLSWKNPGFNQKNDHPVVGVSWEDANQFCQWLTRKERSEGVLPSFKIYRLPTDAEWSQAVGLTHETGRTPEERSGNIKNVYPWGNEFPPPNDTGNYAGSESRVDAPDNWTVIAGFHDAFPRTGPVTAFAPNPRGFSSAGGNVWEWCQDKYQANMNWRTLRGGSWATSKPEEMLSSYRRGYDPYFRSDDVGFRCVIASEGTSE